MTRKTKLEKALAYAAFYEGRKLAPLHAVLLEAIENLEDIQAWCRDRAAQHTITNMKCLSLSTEALAKIDKALEKTERGEK